MSAALAPPRRIPVVGQPTAYAAAGLVVAIAFAIGIAWSTETVPRDVEARLAYAQCLADGRGLGACAPRREAADALCQTHRSADDCAALLHAAEAAPAVALAAGPSRVHGPLRASTARAARFTAAALLTLAVVLATRGHGRRRVRRVALGAAIGLALAAAPALAALGVGALVAAIVPGSDLVLVGFGLFVGTFVAVLAMPAFAGAADDGDARWQRVHASLAALAAGTAVWILLVGPIAGPVSVWLQAISAHALAVSGYLLRRAV
jgi:hypothetical protein